jgi:hypothetical protein
MCYHHAAVLHQPCTQHITTTIFIKASRSHHCTLNIRHVMKPAAQPARLEISAVFTAAAAADSA